MTNHHNLENCPIKITSTIRCRNLRGIYKNRNRNIQGLSPLLLLMPRQCKYDLYGNKFRERRRGKSVRYDSESISFLVPKVRCILPNEIKD